MKRIATLALLTTIVALGGCETAYYATMEKVGIPKRDILVSRVESARDSQQDAKQEITDVESVADALFEEWQGEVTRVDAQVNQLVTELNAASADANRFIADLGANGG